MTLSSMFKKAGLAVAFLLTAQVAQAGVPAPVTFTFGADVLAGPFAGTPGSGFFTYDPNSLVTGFERLGPPGGASGLPGLLDFSFTILGETFSMGDDVDFPDFPLVDFLNFVPDAVDFLVMDIPPAVDILIPGGVQQLGVAGPLSVTPLLPGSPIGATNTFDFYVEAFITPTAVPVPPALWLFGSGLLGLVGMARRRQA